MRLKDLREDRDMTQSFIANLLHIKQNTYSNHENGRREIPIEALIKLAEFYNASVDYIHGLTDEQRPYPRKKNI